MLKNLSNAPVYYALAQAQFNPIAAMDSYVPKIQDKLRLKGYTLFEQQDVQQLHFGFGDSQPNGKPDIKVHTSWVFTKADRTSGYILSPSSITFHTTHYTTKKDFIPELVNGLKAVHEVVNLDHVSRLGLRYLDAVLPRAGEKVNQYLAGGVHGISLKATRHYSLSESVFETPCATLLSKATMVSKVHHLTAPLGFPPDMGPNGLTLMKKFASGETQEHAVIDTDHFAEGNAKLEFTQIYDQLLRLHSEATIAFEEIASAHALAVWG
jgi:uncharacterized protein (TIGR04255 family)